MNINFIIASIGVFLVIILLLVAILLSANARSLKAAVISWILKRAISRVSR